MTLLRWLALALPACASGASPDVGGDASASADAGQATIDGAPVDAPALRTLSQTTSQQLEPATSIACPATTAGTAANNYYRVFDLVAYGIDRDFHVTQVSFQVEHSDQIGGSGGSTVVVRVGTYAGTPADTLVPADMVILASTPAIGVPEILEDLGPPATTPGGTVIAPISATIPTGSKLLVEVDSPDGNNSHYLYLGANNDGEAGAGYILAPRCGVSVPTSISTVSDPDVPVHLLLTVSGAY